MPLCITIPSSKSISNRALILASLGDSLIILKNVLWSEDIEFLRSALEKMGVEFNDLNKTDVKIIPPKNGLTVANGDFFIGNGGTPARFLVALSLIIHGKFRLHGVDRMHERPFEDLFKAIESLGVEVQYEQKPYFLPAVIEGTGGEITKKNIKISGKISSQFVSGLLLAASGIKNPLQIDIEGNIPSRPYVNMTQELLRIWDVKLSSDGTFFAITPTIKNPEIFSVPADCSSASYPMAYAILKKSPITIKNFGKKTLQGDEKFLKIAESFGAKIDRTEDSVTIKPAKKNTASGKTLDFSTIPDTAMTGMILGAATAGKTHFIGLESLRVKECDRIDAMAKGLQKLGVEVVVDGDEVTIVGTGKISAEKNLTIDSRSDHRIAMVFGVLRSALGLDFKINDEECVKKSWPDFWLDLAFWEGALRPVASVILSRENNGKTEYLIVKKPRKDHAWQFPQGGVNDGETSVRAATRELAEECGADLQYKLIDDDPVDTYRYFFPEDFDRHDPKIRGAKVLFFRAKYVSGDVQVDGTEIIDYRWVEKEDLAEFFSTEYMGAVKIKG